MSAKVVPVITCLLVTLILGDSLAAQFGRSGAGGIGTRGPIPTDSTGSTTVSLQPPPVIDPDLVLLNVSVTGSGNNAVPGISRDRFQVFEDGDEQKITYFWE